MTLTEFLEFWSIAENPFQGEEARHDAVFARVGLIPTPGAPNAPTGAERPAMHADFEKVLGDLSRPSSAIVFGEKGSGKTAIRLQIARRVEFFNAIHPTSRALLVAYDDLNQPLDQYAARFVGAKTTADEALKKLRHLDHIDGILAMVVPRVVDELLGAAKSDEPIGLGAEARKTARKLDAATRREILLLQAVYDRAEEAPARTTRLRRLLRLPLPSSYVLWTALAFTGWAPVALVAAWAVVVDPGLQQSQGFRYSLLALLGLWGLALVKRSIWDRLAMLRLGRRLRRQVRVSGRSELSYARSLRQLEPVFRDQATIPLRDSDEPRYAMVRRMRRVLAPFGFATIIVVVDRVDEPAIIRGDPGRMRSVVWPMLNNKFLQQEGVGIKLLLPTELRHALFKESSAFFEEARLDKQNLIERLSWTGATLYDLCDARLRACRPAEAKPITLLDLFAEDVTRQDLVDALDQMHQPRDAFKLLYHCVSEHCATAAPDAEAGPARWKISRVILEMVRKQQAERVQQLYRGIRPA